MASREPGISGVRFLRYSSRDYNATRKFIPRNVTSRNFFPRNFLGKTFLGINFFVAL
jgi:hypothetical protein